MMELLRLKLKMESQHKFSCFLGYVNPKYQLEWFHKVIADHCQKLLEGKIKNLMVFVPPQHGKSEIVSRNFPAFALGQNPDLKIVGCSYSAELACQFSRAIQRTIDGEEFQSIFPETYLNGSNIRTDSRGYLRNVDIFECVNHKGFYKAVGVGGGLTGTPVDIAIIDDPVKDAVEANSETYRERVWDWYNMVLTTRLHNHSKQLFIMTRWHDDDLAGRILKAEGQDWCVLNIPAICETENDGGLSHRHVGEALWENKHSLAKLIKQRERAPREFNALYQQHPSVEEGNIVKREWFQRISKAEFNALHFNEPVHYFLDTAYDEKHHGDNDPSGILSACKIKQNIYITNACKVWKSFPDLIKFLPEWMNANGRSSASTLRIEPKANGISVYQVLKEKTSLNVAKTKAPTESKGERLHAVTPKIECGRVFLVEGAWNEEFIDELCGFPKKPHDEYVDILGYCINYFAEEDFELPDNIDDLF